MLSALPDDI
jgi:hypothetical protein